MVFSSYPDLPAVQSKTLQFKDFGFHRELIFTGPRRVLFHLIFYPSPAACEAEAGIKDRLLPLRVL